MEVPAIFQILQISPQIVNILPGSNPAMCEARLQEEARGNFRRLSQVHHPDKGGDEEIMKTLITAYEEIKIVNLRKQPTVMQISIHPAATLTREMYGGSDIGLQIQSGQGSGWVWTKKRDLYT